jgi:hypothetical protein
MVSAAGIAMFACSDGPTERPFDPSPLSLSVSTTNINFEVAGFTYGPEFEEVQPGSCTKLSYLAQDTIDIIPNETSDELVIYAVRRQECAAIARDPGGNPYNGGEIRIMAGRPEFPENTLLGFLWADWGTGSETFGMPTNSAAAFRAYPKEGCVFLQWQYRVAPSTNATYYDNPLILHASALGNAKITGEFQCGAEPPPPPPPPPDSTPMCDEPPCDLGGLAALGESQRSDSRVVSTNEFSLARVAGAAAVGDMRKGRRLWVSRNVG